MLVGKRKKAFVLQFRAYYIRKYFINLNGRLSNVFLAPLSMLSNVKMKTTSKGRVLHHITVALICALVDRAISKEAHVLESKRAHFSRVSPITV